MELPKDKRPPDDLIWHNNQRKLSRWLDSALGTTKKKDKDIFVSLDEVEG